MIKCSECKFWYKGETYNCIDKKVEGKYGKCKNSAFSYQDAIDGRTDMLIYGDYESYAAGFDTGADFGCIHGQSR